MQLNQPSKQLPVTHSPSKGLTLPNNIPSVNSHSYNQLPMTSLPGGVASTLLPTPKIQALPSASSKYLTTKCKSMPSEKIALPNNIPSADFHNYKQTAYDITFWWCSINPITNTKDTGSSISIIKNINYKMQIGKTPQKKNTKYCWRE